MSASASHYAALIPLLTFGLTAGTCWGLIGLALRRERYLDVLDQPNERSLHQLPVPRIGGYLMMQSVAIALVLTGLIFTESRLKQGPEQTMAAWLSILAGAALLTWVGRQDDRGPLSVGPRLLTHLGCAGLVAFIVSPTAASTLAAISEAYFNGPAALETGLYAALTTGLLFILITLSVAWFTNLYNFMDGANGLAGLMTLIGFGTYAAMAPAGSTVGNISAACAGAALGFLVFNWDPARIFMGDAGSIPLGFLAATLGLTGAQAGYWGWFAPLGIFLPFVFDATTTLALRAWRGERLTAAHRSHAYQILVISGLGHHRTALIFGLLMAICSLTSATSGYLSDPFKWAVWAVIILIHAGVMLAARLKT